MMQINQYVLEFITKNFHVLLSLKAMYMFFNSKFYKEISAAGIFLSFYESDIIMSKFCK